MSSVNIQFHALPEELLALATEWAKDFPLYLIAIKFPPYEAIEVDSGVLPSIFADGSPFSELLFSTSPPVLPARGTLDLVEKNPNALRLPSAGELRKVLANRRFQEGGENAEASRIWNKIGRQVKKLSTTGVLVVHPETGETSPAPRFRFTAGAKAFDASGGALLSFTGLRMTLIENILGDAAAREKA